MTETPQPKSNDEYDVNSQLTDMRELLLDVVKQQDRNAGKNNGADTEEYLRILRLMRTERHSYETFANNFSSQAESILRKVDEGVQPKLIELEAAAETSLAAIRTAGKKAEGDKKLYLELQKGAQEAVDEMRNAKAELLSAQEDLRTMINATMKRWNEQTQQITAANVEKAAGEAAEKALAAMTEAKLTELVDRRIRAVQSNA